MVGNLNGKYKHYCMFKKLMENLYELLNLSEEASVEEIKRHCQQLLLQTHPDKNKDSVDTTLFIKVQKAREILLDPHCRAKYNKTLKENRLQNSQKILFDKVYDDDLNVNEVTGEFFLDCRCGGLYTVLESDIYGIIDIPCTNCTLFLRVTKQSTHKVFTKLQLFYRFVYNKL
ncbi:dnaJ homolog subfamily C member 24 isoform X1 [Hydra vulgaris]|uniref:dnaJ homolog subfamily C member 24 isoform X1 n=1 Tax=Hydra vulgaris TaxID=6087 RepID=UPI001F5FEDA7|nr:dnaJ homolog subfamily C member 24-like [Hydra vulgaris]